MLGQDHARGGGVAGRKRRFEVLDRLARTGGGLSAAQKNEFGWFKEAWDEKMLQEHAEDWGQTFASWMQRIIDEVDSGVGNAFSAFIHAETERNFSGVPALLVP